MRVLMQPIGNGDWQLLTTIALQVPLYLPFAECVVAPKVLPLTAPAIAHRRQWLATALLTQLPVPTGFDRVLGVVNVDIFAPPYNFVFGVAEVGGKRALISLARLKGQDGNDSQALLERRAVKEVLHELGHTLGLAHCQDPTCVAAFSNSLADTDKKGPAFCPRCQQQIVEAWRRLSDRRR